jgi:nucleotidyltransferase substrate binding protein (TIGR01987 family)
MNQETKSIFNQLNQALSRLEEIIHEPISANRVEIDATIHRFEFVIELFWKALKKKLYVDHGIEVASPKQVMQHAYANKLITNESIWLDMLEDRNLTSHTYKQDLADKVYNDIKKYTPFLRQEFQHCNTTSANTKSPSTNKS